MILAYMYFITIYKIFTTFELLTNKKRISEIRTQDFTKIYSHACSSSNGEYLTWKEANLICSADPKCKFVQRDACLYSNIFSTFKICGYKSSLTRSNYSCVYQKKDIDHSGRIFSNLVATPQGNDRILDHVSDEKFYQS